MPFGTIPLALDTPFFLFFELPSSLLQARKSTLASNQVLGMRGFEPPAPAGRKRNASCK